MAAQRFYHASTGSGAPAESPTYSAVWNKTSLATRLKLLTTPDSSAEVNEVKLQSNTSGDLNLSYQWVGEAVGAGSTAGTETLRSQFITLTGADREYYPAMRVFMWDPVGDAVRCVLYETVETGGTKLAVGTQTNRIFPPGGPVTLAAVSWNDGDMPVIEVGVSVRTALSAQNERIRHGAPTSGGASTDLGSNETDTAGRSWTEFSFTFAAVGGAETDAPAGNAAGTGAASNAAASLKPNAGNAAGTGTANAASASLKPNGGVATGTGAAGGPTSSVATSGGVAAGTGAASDAATTVGASGGLASGAGAAQNPSIAILAAALQAVGTGTAYDPTVTTTADVLALALLAAGTGTAYDPTISAVSGAVTGGHGARRRSPYRIDPMYLDPDGDDEALVLLLASRRRLL